MKVHLKETLRKVEGNSARTFDWAKPRGRLGGSTGGVPHSVAFGKSRFTNDRFHLYRENARYILYISAA